MSLYQNDEPVFIFFDLLSGAGGVTTGLLKARNKNKRLVKIAGCINHDPFAILSHAYNHKHIKHFIEDIRTFDVRKFKKLAALMRRRYPNAKICVWASLECTNYSKAKGGKSRDADSRTLAMYMPQYIKAIDPDFVFIENVMEFMDGCELIPKEIWEKRGKKMPNTAPQDYHHDLDMLDWYYQRKVDAGEIGYCPLDIKKPKGAKKNAVPDILPVWYPNPNKLGNDYREWVDTIKAMGYNYAWKDMNAADYGCHTSRIRYFGLFGKYGLPLIFPEPSHHKTGADGLHKWLPVKEVLDFDDKGEDIMPEVRDGIKGKKALSPKTYARVFEGCIKHLANGDRSFLTKGFSSHNNTRMNGGASVNKPCDTVTAQSSRMSLVQIEGVDGFIVKYNGNHAVTGINNGVSLTKPCQALTTQDRLRLLQVEPVAGFVARYNSTGDNTSSLDRPGPVIPTHDSMSLYQAEYFLNKKYSGENNHQSINSPAGAVMNKDTFQLVEAEKHFIASSYSGGGQTRSIEEPNGALLTVRKDSIVNCELSKDHHYLIMPQYGDKCSHSVEKPSMTLIARMDKTVPYLVTLEDGRCAIRINKNDLPEVKNIKMFMAAYGIKRIRMRMLKDTELLQIQEFPKNYKLFGDSAERKKFIGNAVPTLVPKAWLEEMGKYFVEQNVFQTIQMLEIKVA